MSHDHPLFLRLFSPQQQQQYTLAVVRLVPPDHAMLSSLTGESAQQEDP